jgi:hypothetical protein
MMYGDEVRHITPPFRKSSSSSFKACNEVKKIFPGSSTPQAVSSPFLAYYSQVYYPPSEIYQKLRALQLSTSLFWKSSSRALKLVKRAAGLYPCKLCKISWQRPRSWLAKATKLAGKGHELSWRRLRVG